jgi:hydroxyethylthiazole kinase-like uncharacterized protein yjeF
MTSDPRHALALLTPCEMAAADRAAIAAGVDSALLMERAGRAVADAVLRRTRPGAAVLVLCGPGNNGGDGFVAARLLRERGHRVELALLGAVASLAGDAAAMAQRWSGAILPADGIAVNRFDLVVDALFGAGLNRPLDGVATALVGRVDAAGCPVVAVDVPSGLSGETGQVQGAAIRASETVTFFRPKPGHLLLPGRTLCGVLTVADIGIAPEIAFASDEATPRTFRNAPALWRAQRPASVIDKHKYRRGAVLVVAGGLEGVGAPRLAARAALRAGAGLATIACRPDALPAHAARGPDALMQRAIPDVTALERLLAEPRLKAVAIGPALGLDTEARQAVAAVLRAEVPAVLDADALTILAARPEGLGRQVARRGAACVLTPHEGEFARLFGDVASVRAATSKLGRARAAAAFSRCVVVLKGADTVIAEPDGLAAINTTGAPALATAGSGDVLGGVIAGLLAQGMPAFAAACAGVWVHGRAGERGRPGLIADDLPELVAEVLAEAGESDGPDEA